MSEIKNSLKPDTQTLGRVSRLPRETQDQTKPTHTQVDPKESPESHRDS